MSVHCYSNTQFLYTLIPLFLCLVLYDSLPMKLSNKLDMRQIAIRTCQPARHVFFVKTHKTGSGTIANIMFRYGIKHDLRIALPKSGCQFGYPRTVGLQVKDLRHFSTFSRYLKFTVLVNGIFYKM